MLNRQLSHGQRVVEGRNNKVSEYADLEKLRTAEIEYNGYFIRPSTLAFEAAERLLAVVPSSMPMPEITPLGDKDIDVEWSYQARKVALHVHSDGDHSLVRMDGRWQNAEGDLLHELGWLFAAEQEQS